MAGLQKTPSPALTNVLEAMSEKSTTVCLPPFDERYNKNLDHRVIKVKTFARLGEREQKWA